MFRPLIGVAVGVLLTVYGLLGYGDRLPSVLPAVMRRPSSLPWLGGTLLLALAAALGIVGSLWQLNLRMARVVLALLGLVLLLLA